MTITITGTNDAPVAVRDVAKTTEDKAIKIDVLANDTDVDSDKSGFSIVSIDTSASAGKVIDNGDGTVTYDPNGAFDSLNDGEPATDTFSYTMSDGDGKTDTAKVTVTINGVGGAPCLTTGKVLSNITQFGSRGADNLCIEATERAFGNVQFGKGGADSLSIAAIGGQSTLVFKNTMDGGEDNDSLSLISQSSGFGFSIADIFFNRLIGGGGDDDLSVSVSGTGFLVGSEFNNLQGGTGDDSLSIVVRSDGQFSRSLVNGNTISGGEGADSLTLSATGGTTNSVISNGLIGGSGDDELTLFAHGGTNVNVSGNKLTGEAGNDVITIDVNAGRSGTYRDNFVFGGDGDDTITANVNSTLQSSSSSNFYSSSNNFYFGQAGKDTISGSNANETLDGGTDNDVLDGGAGRDRLIGGSGDDVLTGGLGRDTLTGGKGSDTFRYTTTDQSMVGAGDVITDFNAIDANEDLLLDGLLSGTFSFLGSEKTDFTGTGNTEARFNDATDILEIDANGDAVVDMEITLSHVALVDLDTTDFTVI